MSFIGDLFGGGSGADAAKDASDAQVKAQREAIEFYKQIYDRQLQLQGPQRNVGNQALSLLGSYYGFDPAYDPYPASGFGTLPGTSGPMGGGNALAGQSFMGGSATNPAMGGKSYPSQFDCQYRKGDKACVEAARMGWPSSTPGGAQPGNAAWSAAAGQQAASGARPPGGQFQGRGFNSLLQSDPVYQFLAGDTLRTLQNDPGYQFRLGEGEQALNRQGAAAGGLYSGAQLKAAQRYGQGFASNEYGQAYGRVKSSYDDAYNRLASLAGVPQIGSATSNISNALSNVGQQVGQATQNIGDARASGYLNQANARQSGFGNVLGAVGAGTDIYSAVKLARLFSSREFKNELGEPSDVLDRIKTLPIKEWAYKPEMGLGTDRNIGPYAQDWAERFGGNGVDIQIISALGVILKGMQEITARLERLEARK